MSILFTLLTAVLHDSSPYPGGAEGGSITRQQSVSQGRRRRRYYTTAVRVPGAQYYTTAVRVPGVQKGAVLHDSSPCPGGAEGGGITRQQSVSRGCRRGRYYTTAVRVPGAQKGAVLHDSSPCPGGAEGGSITRQQSVSQGRRRRRYYTTAVRVPGAQYYTTAVRVPGVQKGAVLHDSSPCPGGAEGGGITRQQSMSRGRRRGRYYTTAVHVPGGSRRYIQAQTRCCCFCSHSPGTAVSVRSPGRDWRLKE